MNPDVAARQPPPKHGIAKSTQASATSTVTLGYISPFEMKAVDNSLNKAVKIGAKLEPANA